MNVVKGAISVFRFELLRSKTVSRISVWFVLALFPPAIVMVVLINAPPIRFPLLSLGIPLMVLIPQAMCLLGLLLWASPVVHSELEGKTWVYLAVRPRGKTAVLLGKYLTAVVWSASACLVGLTLTVPLAAQLKMDTYRPSFHQRGRNHWENDSLPAQPSAKGEHAVENPVRMWFVYATLVALSSLGYGALYLLIGTIFHRRAMVVAVAYTVISEFAVTWIPAVINQFTLAYHLRCLLKSWMNWNELPDHFNPVLFGAESVEQHLLILLGATVCLLVIADTIVNKREYISAAEA